MKCVIYQRVAIASQQSTDPSPDGQLARCLAYAEAHGWTSVALYVDDTRGDTE